MPFLTKNRANNANKNQNLISSKNSNDQFIKDEKQLDELDMPKSSSNEKLDDIINEYNNLCKTLNEKQELLRRLKLVKKYKERVL